MKEDYRRHDISDRAWALLEPHLPGRHGAWGRVAQDNRRFINAVIWILRTGLLGEIYLLNMVIGKIRTGVFADGEIKVFGKNYSICLLKTLTLNGS